MVKKIKKLLKPNIIDAIFGNRTKPAEKAKLSTNPKSENYKRFKWVPYIPKPTRKPLPLRKSPEEEIW